MDGGKLLIIGDLIMGDKSYKDRNLNNGFYPGDIVKHKETGKLFMVIGSYAMVCGSYTSDDRHFHIYDMFPITDCMHPDPLRSSAWHNEDDYELLSAQSSVILQNIMYDFYKWRNNRENINNYNKIFNSIKIEL